jgi:hypothetical protein
MSEIIAVIFCFLLVSAVANICQKHFGYSYERHWPLHIALILGGIAAIHLYTSVLSTSYLIHPKGMVLGIIAASIFMLAELLRGKYIDANQYWGVQALGGAYTGLLAPRLSGVSVKIIEIFFQDIVLLSISLGLLETHSILFSSFCVVLVVFLVHLPGIYFLGRVYGVIFTVLATLFAVAVPTLVSSTSGAFYLIFSVHMLMYPVIMLLLQTRNPFIEK